MFESKPARFFQNDFKLNEMYNSPSMPSVDFSLESSFFESETSLLQEESFLLEPKKKKLLMGDIPGLKTYKKVDRFDKPQKTDRIETKSHLPTPTKDDKENTVKVNSLLL